MRIVFFGTSQFAANILACLIEQKIDIIAIVTRPDRPSGRDLKLSFPPVKQFLQLSNKRLPLYQPPKASTPEFVAQMALLKPDLFIVVAYGEIIKKNLLDVPKFGCINVHASLLPKYRGAAPMQRALMKGESSTGITIIEMNEQMDGGDIIAAESIPVPLEMTHGELEEQLCHLGASLLLQVLRAHEKGDIKKIPQNSALATLAPKILPEETVINWNLPADQLHNLIRALSPQPGAWAPIVIGNEKKRLKIKRSRIVQRQGAPGTILSQSSEGFIIACARDALSFEEVQLEGKKMMSIQDFLKGVRSLMQF